jgi:mRNA interferase MazF
VLVVSADELNSGPAGLSIVVPLTTRDRGIALHVPVDPPEGGVREHSVLMPEQVHATDQSRLVDRWGRVSEDTISAVEDSLRIVLHLEP